VQQDLADYNLKSTSNQAKKATKLNPDHEQSIEKLGLSKNKRW